MTCSFNARTLAVPHTSSEINLDWAKWAIVQLVQRMRKAHKGDVARLADYKQLQPLQDIILDRETQERLARENPALSEEEVIDVAIRNFVNGRLKLFTKYGVLPTTFVADGGFERYHNDYVRLVGEMIEGVIDGYVMEMDRNKNVIGLEQYSMGIKQHWAVGFTTSSDGEMELDTVVFYEDNRIVFGLSVNEVEKILDVCRPGEMVQYRLDKCRCLLTKVKDALFSNREENMSFNLDWCTLNEVSSLFFRQ